MRIRWLVLIVGLSLWATGCSRRTDADAPAPRKPRPKASSRADAAPPAKAAEDKPKKKRRRLPKPLGPRGPGALSLVDGQERACDRLVSKVCELRSEGADECRESRQRIERRPGTVSVARCREALEWFQEAVEGLTPKKRRRLRPCKLLASELCRVNGKASTACATARREASFLKKKAHRRACLAELLLLKGLP